ncbi:MAG TPA: ribosomal protein S18-alanine N-acetyltransferase [Rhizomicrobium sp.]|nr:ribosomal protein S18-alanine N-acetyltransferase [Rhizomicrobium sp.]
MSLRPATESDFAELAHLHKACFAESWDERALKDLVATGARTLLAEQDGRFAGFILFRTVSDESEILTLAVAPEARRSGMGRALVTQAAQQAARAGATRLFLEVGANNAAARALYAGLGFTPAGQRKGYYSTPGAPPEDALILCLQLPLSGLGNGPLVG